MVSYGIALYCQMRNLAKTQIRIYKMSLKFLGDIFVLFVQHEHTLKGASP